MFSIYMRLEDVDDSKHGKYVRCFSSGEFDMIRITIHRATAFENGSQLVFRCEAPRIAWILKN